jgi:hypothetical protein
VAVAGDHGGGRDGEVLPGGGADAALAGRPEQTVGHGGRDVVVLDVPAVAQQHVRQPGLGEHPLGLQVLLGEHQVGGVGVRDAGVGDQSDPGLDRGRHDGPVLGDALADVAARDEQQPLGPVERGAQRIGLGVVGPAHGDAALGQVGEPLHSAAGGHDLRGRHAPAQQLLDHDPAELPGGPGDDDGHAGPPSASAAVRRFPRDNRPAQRSLPQGERAP